MTEMFKTYTITNKSKSEKYILIAPRRITWSIFDVINNILLVVFKTDIPYNGEVVLTSFTRGFEDEISFSMRIEGDDIEVVENNDNIVRMYKLDREEE